jgi:hypothetical protein
MKETTLKRLKTYEARAIIAEELQHSGWETASSFTVEDGRRPGTEDLSWWHENTPRDETSETPRSTAYLRAYVKIGGPRLFAGGLFLDRRRLWMDRSIISRLERDGYLAFHGEGTREPFFALTERGEQLVSGREELINP